MARIRTTRQARAIRFGLAFGYHDAYRVFSTGEGPKNRPFKELTQKAYDVAYLRETNKLHTAEDFEALRGRAGRILRSQGYGSRKVKEEEPPVAPSRRSVSRSSSDMSYTPIVVDTYVDGGSSSASFSCD